jgi:hypothetical protein
MLDSASMLKEGVRHCDVCGEVILKGQKYSVSLVPKDQAQLADSLFEAAPDMAATRTVDDSGNLRLDICLECKLNMVTPGETVQ